MNDSLKLQQEPTLGQLLAHVSRLVGQWRRIKLAGIGLHHAQGMILSRLRHADGLSQQDLAKALHISPPTASNTLQRMERDGWIIRRRDETDQRIVRVYLTAKAKSFNEEILAMFRELDHELGSALSEREQEDFRNSLQKVYRHLVDKAGEQESCCFRAVKADGEEQ